MTWLKRHSDAPVPLALFFIALVPRALDLGAFASADEAKWVYRSAQFLAAVLQGNPAGTAVNLTPAVTTTWLGALGLTVYHALGGAAGVPLVDWLAGLPEFRTDLDVLVAVRWPMVLLGSLAVSGLFALSRRLVGQRAGLAAGLLLALDPQMVALSRLLGHDAPAGLFTGLALLALLVALGQSTRRGRLLWYVGSGVLTGLALLSKSPAFFLIPFAGLAGLMAALVGGEPHPPTPSPGSGEGGRARSALVAALMWRLSGLVVWAFVAWLVFVAAWPAAWLRPVGAITDVVHNAFLSATDTAEASAEGFWQVPDLGGLYYPVNLLFKLSPLATLGLAAWLASRLAAGRRPPTVASVGPHPTASDMVEPHPPAPSSSGPHPPAPSPLRGEGESPPSPLAERGLGGEVLLERGSGSEVPAQRGSGGELLAERGSRREVEWLLLAFAILFVIFMTLGGKRSNRYLLPAWPALYLLAGLGLTRLAAALAGLRLARGVRLIAAALLIALLGLPAVVSHPYYLSYVNPLVGGALTAPRLVKIGWGEGLDQVGRWLQSQPDAAALRVGSPYPSAMAPFFSGRLSDVTAGRLDYVVTYIKQIQEGDPSPTWQRYFQAETPVLTVRLGGIDYARVYPGPSLQPALASEAAFDIGILPKPLFYRPDRPYAAIGEPLSVTVVWLADARLPTAATRMTLQPAADLTEPPEDRTGPVWAEAAAALERRSDGLVVSRYRLALPDDLPRGSYGLLVDGRPLGTVDARRFQPPPLARRVDATFADQVRLLGVVEEGEPGPDATLQLVWQASPRAWADYTVFLHLLDAEGQRVAGVDAPPPAPTGDWARGEVVVMTYAPGTELALPIPRDLPPGEYRLAVGLYRPDTGERLPVRDAAGGVAGDSVVLLAVGQ